MEFDVGLDTCVCGQKKTPKTNIIPERRKGWGWNSGVVVPEEVGILLTL